MSLSPICCLCSQISRWTKINPPVRQLKEILGSLQFSLFTWQHFDFQTILKSLYSQANWTLSIYRLLISFTTQTSKKTTIINHDKLKGVFILLLIPFMNSSPNPHHSLYSISTSLPCTISKNILQILYSIVLWYGQMQIYLAICVLNSNSHFGVLVAIIGSVS